MERADDGDLIRALGYLILYSGYLEFRLESLLELLMKFGLNDYNIMWPISRKSKKVKKVFENIKRILAAANTDKESLSDTILGLENIIDILEDCTECLKLRNKYAHGYIYHKISKGDRIKSIRPSNSDNEINSKMIYDVANELFALQSEVNSITLRLKMPSFSSVILEYQRLTSSTQKR